VRCASSSAARLINVPGDRVNLQQHDALCQHVRGDGRAFSLFLLQIALDLLGQVDEDFR